MGWISKRHMEGGGSIGGRRNRVYPKDGAPLVRVACILRRSESMFEPDRVQLECGHEGDSWGGIRARCPKCKKP